MRLLLLGPRQWLTVWIILAILTVLVAWAAHASTLPHQKAPVNTSLPVVCVVENAIKRTCW